ncbi:MAG: Rv2175c family DNA-binding protein [Micromonosporaceae bacterium]
MTDKAEEPSDLPAAWLPLPDVAERMGVRVTRVRQMVRDGALLAVRRDGVLVVPAELMANDNVLKHLPGVLTLLHDAGYNDEDALRWLYAADDSLPGVPAVALAGPLATEVKRRAQAVGF